MKETFFEENFILFNLGKKYFCININIQGATVKNCFSGGANFLGDYLCWY